MTEWTKEEQAEHRRLWVNELRSGKHRQARNQLRAADGSMCCLGVACEVSGLGHWDNGWYLGNSGMLPDIVRQWLGLASSCGTWNREVAGGAGHNALSDHNDRGKTFAEIADLIESEPPGLLA